MRPEDACSLAPVEFLGAKPPHTEPTARIEAEQGTGGAL